MPIARPSQSEILSRIHNKIRLNTSLTANLDSSMIGMLTKIIAAEMDMIWQYVEEAERQSNISTATGENLDNFGMLFAVPRKTEAASSTAGLARSVRFTNNGATTVNIPTGTRVWKTEMPSLAYFTIETVSITAGSSEFVHVRAAETGEVYNVGVGELTAHNHPITSVTVTNVLPIMNGESRESDASYRERILQEMSRRDVVNSSNIVALLRSVPGVRDIYLLEGYRGHGTFDAVIVPYNYSDISTVVSECQELINDAVPVGISGRAVPPTYRQLDIRVSLQFAPGTSSRWETVREAIKVQISSMVDNLPVEDGSGSGTFYASRIQSTAQTSDAIVLDARVSLNLDSVPYSSEGEIRVGKGERLIIRSLAVA